MWTSFQAARLSCSDSGLIRSLAGRLCYNDAMNVFWSRAAVGLAVFCLLSGMQVSSGAVTRRPVPDFFRRAVVYQIALRTFTRDGNFRAATEMLDHVKGAGMDAVLLLPFVEMDRDMDERGWSPRQIRSGFNTPKNPYRISDFNRIDPEYGTEADLVAFCAKAHAVGLKVFMDVVYMHAGPNNVLGEMFPDAFQKNPDGTVRTTAFNFPYVNFASAAVRKYLVDSMLRWMKLGCDGFRCDMGDCVPIDFWTEAAAACRAVNPDFILVNEGAEVGWVEKAFDSNYALAWSYAIRGVLTPGCRCDSYLVDGSLAKSMDAVWAYEAKLPADAMMLSFVDNHDTAADDWEKRFDRVHPVEAGNAAFVLSFLRKGVPMVYNGNEIADNGRNSFFAPGEDVARLGRIVDWARAVQPAGQKRLSLIRRLSGLRRSDGIFPNGTMVREPAGEARNVVAFYRLLGGRRVLVAANLKGDAVRVDFGKPVEGRRILSEGVEGGKDGTLSFGPWGYIVEELR